MGLFGGGDKASSSSSRTFDRTTTFDRFAPSTFGVNRRRSGDATLNVFKNVNGKNIADANLATADQARAIGSFETFNRSARDRIAADASLFRSNRNPFIDARVRPLQENAERRRAEIGRGFSQRGVFGSLSANEVSNFDERSQREIADQRSLATQESIGAAIAADAQAANLNNNELQLASFLLERELRELGIGLEALGLSQSNQQFIKSQRETGSETATGRSKQESGTGIGDVLGFASSFF